MTGQPASCGEQPIAGIDLFDVIRDRVAANQDQGRFRFGLPPAVDFFQCEDRPPAHGAAGNADAQMLAILLVRPKDLDTKQLATMAKGEIPEAMRGEQEHVAWADVLTFVYPLWWAGPPAIAKGWTTLRVTSGRDPVISIADPKGHAISRISLPRCMPMAAWLDQSF